MQRRAFLSGAAALAAAPVFSTQSEEGMTPLFDGASLRGWTITEGPESAFYVKEGAIVVHEGSNYPAWLRSERQYENFDFRCEYYIRGWMDSGIFLHAPEHGRPTWTGFNIKLFQKLEDPPSRTAVGSVFPIVPPLKTNVKNRGEWNTFRAVFDWPRLQVWMNDDPVQDLNVESNPELRWRLRRGYLGLQSLAYPIRFRKLRIRELPGKEQWETLYEQPSDLEKWFVADGKPVFEPLGGVLRSDGLGHLATKEQYGDFELHAYIRASEHSNGGVLFRCDADRNKRHYEIQLHDVEDAVYPTGSLYYFERARYPKIEPEKWYLLQLVAKGGDCLVRINGETVMEYHSLENTAPGHIMLQAHQAGRWIEYKHIRIKRL